MNCKSKKVAIIAPPWWLIPSKNTVTATEHLVEDYAFYLGQGGFQSVIFSRDKDYTDEHEREDVNGYENKYVYTKVSQMDRKIFASVNLFFYFYYIFKISIKVRKQKIKNIIVFQTFPFCFWLRILNPDSKILFHIGGHELSKKQNYFNYGYISDSLAYKVLPRVDYILTVSKHLQEKIQERFPNFKSKIKFVYAGIDTDIFKNGSHIKNKKNTIIFAGRVVPEKGVLILVSAFKKLKKKYHNLKLYIIGESLGPNIPSDFDKNFEIEDVVRIKLLPRRELAKILRRGDIFVYPVIMEETFGLAPIEAMASGLITVVSDTHSGYKEIITDKVNGYYFKTGNENSLVAVLEEILLSDESLETLRRNGVSVVKEKLSWERCIEETVVYFT